jgi:hypothetical protein
LNNDSDTLRLALIGSIPHRALGLYEKWKWKRLPTISKRHMARHVFCGQYINQ